MDANVNLYLGLDSEANVLYTYGARFKARSFCGRVNQTDILNKLNISFLKIPTDGEAYQLAVYKA